jgi:threonine synthase
VRRLVIATNANDILARTLATGRYELRSVVPTQSPSMDIQVSSNFERLLFDVCGREAGEVRALMGSLEQSKGFSIAEGPLAAIRGEFDAYSANEEATAAEIARTYRETGYVLDPHSATGVHAARLRLAEDPATPLVALATAHPAKFPDAIERVIGVRPPLPEYLSSILSAPERFTVIANDSTAVAAFIGARARAARGRA